MYAYEEILFYYFSLNNEVVLKFLTEKVIVRNKIQINKQTNKKKKIKNGNYFAHYLFLINDTHREKANEARRIYENISYKNQPKFCWKTG